MSQPSSNQDSLFDSVDFQAAEPTEGYDPMAEEAVFQPAAAKPQKRQFDIYSMFLILSFIMLTTAAVLFFQDAGKY